MKFVTKCALKCGKNFRYGDIFSYARENAKIMINFFTLAVSLFMFSLHTILPKAALLSFARFTCDIYAKFFSYC